MATYNGARYIREQLESILSQTIQDFELIICDDCSTDCTLEIVKEYADKDNRIQVFVNDENLGYRKNFEKTALMCKGNLVAFCDQDDIWLPNHLAVLSENIGERDVCTANAEIINGEGISLGFKLSDFTRLNNWPDRPLDQAYTFFYYRNPFPGCNTLFRSTFLQKAFPIQNENIRLHDTWVDALACLSGNGICYIDQVTMLYRFHSNSVTAGSRGVRRQSPYRCIISKFLFGTKSYMVDRKYYCDEINARMLFLNDEQRRFFRRALIYHSRRNSVWGRTLNLFFDIMHLRKIYNL